MATRSAWVLNLDADHELEDPRGYTPSRATRERVRDFAARLHGLLRPGDVVLEAGTTLPPGSYAGKAWCPTPRALAMLEAAGCELPDSPSLPVLQRVNDRRFAIELGLGSLRTQYVTDATSAIGLLQATRPGDPWLMKRAFGLSGRGHRRGNGPPSDADLRWLNNSLRRGHGVSIEPWVTREADFAVHGRLTREGAFTLGRAVLQRCDARGRWQESLAAPAGSLQAEESEQLRSTAKAVAHALHEAGYFGPFGIDAFAYRDEAGQRCFHPLVEINARYCMGWPFSGLDA
jgi:hypothetical protein